MEQFIELFQLTGFPHVTLPMIIMWGIVGILLYFAVYKQYEPLLLIPIAFGALLANIPSENLIEEPAGEVITTDSGTIVASALKIGDTFRVPPVTTEIAAHLSRFSHPAKAQQLFVEEKKRATAEKERLQTIAKKEQVKYDAAEAKLKATDASDKEAIKEATRKRDIAKQEFARAQNNVKTQRGGIIVSVIRPGKNTPPSSQNTIADPNAENAQENWKKGHFVQVPWIDATGKETTLLVNRDDRVLSTPATGTVISARAVGEEVTKGSAIGKLHSEHVGGLYHFIKLGVLLELFPPLIFLGIGALTDFGPLIANPKTLLLGAAAQLGVFMTFIAAVLIGFTAGEAASIGIIGGADGPTSIFLANKLAPHLMAAIAVAAYSYMALVPLIQPPIMRLLTTEKERKIRMSNLRKVGRVEKLVFAVVVATVCILLVPPVAPLIGMLMLGNFFRESGVTERLSKTAQNELINIVTIFLGTSVGITMTADRFLRNDTLLILALGVVAFGFSTAGGVIMVKIMNLFLKQKINPLIGSAGVSAVPMAARVSQVEGQKADPTNYLLMHAMGPNVAGVIGSAIAAGFFISILGSH
ncbi:MAG: sodium ion-translocating decarboxylase subunit beta [Puniceicoccales bacterium]|jgi:oxaloacetate decarboxylase beta subunit|nr:sodium ion-translocating decarboxylase subunit beta [Puniceicoccales bacterium]